MPIVGSHSRSTRARFAHYSATAAEPPQAVRKTALPICAMSPVNTGRKARIMTPWVPLVRVMPRQKSTGKAT